MARIQIQDLPVTPTPAPAEPEAEVANKPRVRTGIRGGTATATAGIRG